MMSIVTFELIVNLLVAVLFFLYWIFNFIILYHLTRFGIGTLPKKFAAIFLLGSIGLFFSSIVLFADIDTSSLGARFGKFGGNLLNLTSPIQ